MTTLILRGDATRIPLPDRSVDLVFGSPPYGPRRTYGIAAGRKLEAWVDWMLAVTAESLRVSRGLVLWVCAGWTRKLRDNCRLGCYQPGPEGLLWEWVKQGGIAWRPCYWRRNGIPGSGQKVWYRADIEYVLAFRRPGPIPFADPTVNGHPPVFAHPGGATNRRVNGDREIRRRQEDGSYRPSASRNPDIADPGNLFRAHVGKNHMGSPLAHDNEAPFPEAVPERFIRSHCPPGGTVLDPFIGSGTTASVASRWGRSAIGMDLRPCQCRLARKRIASQAGMFDSQQEVPLAP